MTDESRKQFQRVEKLFAAVQCSAPEQRAQKLAEMCGDDDHLRQQVQQLLEASDNANSFLEPSSDHATFNSHGTASTPGGIPERIGPYHIKRIIATGGMGTVYEAVQEHPRRTVALKVMRPGIASRSALRRFEHESQVLARLRHPAIAQVYQAGTDGEGDRTVPYFAMEYIPNAKPITKYTEHRPLGTRERLELFARVCDGVHHGHQKGIIHRDLKPANILVDSHGQPKIIDFGVARSTDSDMTATTLQTDVGQLIGTLQYMSPEQCDADPHDLDVRSDVYSLGVVLYQLLCGHTPYDVTHLALHEATRVVREQQAAKLSTINARLGGDIETIVHNALEKDRDRRYRSAAELADDIRRYLSGEAIRARPPSIVYQFRMLARRNKAACGSIAAVFAVLFAGTVVSTAMYLRSAQARAQAITQREQTRLAKDEAVSAADFLIHMFAAIHPARVGETVTIHDMLDDAARRLDEGVLVNQPLVEASFRELLGATYEKLNISDLAETQFRIALGHRGRIQGPEHPLTLAASSQLARAYLGQEKNHEGLTLARKTFETQAKVLGRDHPETLKSMRWLTHSLSKLGALDEAEELLQQLLAAHRRMYGDEHTNTLWTMNDLAQGLGIRGRYRESIEIRRRIVESRKRLQSENHYDTLFAMERLAFALRYPGASGAELKEAEMLARRVLQLGEERFGDWFRFKDSAMYALAAALRDQGEYAEAETLFNEVLETKVARDGPRHPGVAGTMIEIGMLESRKGDLDTAVQMYLQGLEILRESLGDNHSRVGDAQFLLGKALLNKKAYDEAESALLDSYSVLKNSLGASNTKTRLTASYLVKLFQATGNTTEAARWQARLDESADTTGE